MQVIGQGGTGKTVLIDAITETFVYKQHKSSLAKCATSGIAAIPIGGCTVHFWAGIGIHRPKTISTSNKKIQERRKKNILGKTCLIIDEMSMMNDTLLADVAKIVAYVKKAGGEGDEHLPFAGIHVILMGDFHQFPPVGNPYSALYSRHPTTIPDALHGRGIFRQFEFRNSGLATTTNSNQGYRMDEHPEPPPDRPMQRRGHTHNPESHVKPSRLS